jgi:hypothetical protein
MSPVNYDVKARVVDITKYVPNGTEQLVVDTSVIIPSHYSKASLALTVKGMLRYQVMEYPLFIKKLKAAKCKMGVYRCIFYEVMHNIEELERKLFNGQLTTKEYRHNFPNEHNNVISEYEVVHQQILANYEIYDCTINTFVLDECVNAFKSNLLDGYDTLQVVSDRTTISWNAYLTDDGDYACLDNVVVYTANVNIIEKARIKQLLVNP